MEYRVIKAFGGWKVGDRIFPNCHLSGGERRTFEAQGFIVPLAVYKASIVKAKPVIPPAEVETAMYESPQPRKRGPGRPRKYAADEPVTNGDDESPEEEINE